MKEDYIQNDGVYCKGCGDRLVKVESGIARAMPTYTEVKLIFDDTTSHITMLCPDCAQNDELDFNEVYQIDVSRWKQELAAEGKGRKVNSGVMKRKVVNRVIL